ncbi:MAG TPA: histidine phosphatase family protein [Acidimicrobiia bacterium]
MTHLVEGAEVWLVRHAETASNLEDRWLGRSESPLTTAGHSQNAALAARLRMTRFDHVVSSPLGRARETAAVIGPASVDDDLTEIDLGRWEGLTTQDVHQRHRTDLARAIADETAAFGGSGESRATVAARFDAAFARLAGRMQPGEKALVVTHGGVLDVLTERTFGRDENGRRIGSFTANTGITRLVQRAGRWRMRSFNDTGHLGPRPSLAEKARAGGAPVLALVRHGRTRANAEGIWQGWSDGGLDDLGRAQATAFMRWYGAPDRLATSRLGRAVETARLLHPEPEVVDGFEELGFGQWEGLTTAEIQRDWPDLFARIFELGHDLPRGDTGETFAQLGQRFARALTALKPGSSSLTMVVTHGAAIRAYLASLAADGWARAASFETPANSSVTHVVITDHGPVVADFSSAVHLESLDEHV